MTKESILSICKFFTILFFIIWLSCILAIYHINSDYTIENSEKNPIADALNNIISKNSFLDRNENIIRTISFFSSLLFFLTGLLYTKIKKTEIY